MTARAEEMWERTERILRAQGVDPETYVTASGRTREELIEQAKEDARRTLGRESVLEAVADAEEIEVSDEELVEALARTAEREGTQPDKLLEQLKENGRDAAVRRELRLRKAVDAIAGSAQPIELEQAKAREALWTPDKQQKEEGSSQLWTPGAGAAGTALPLTGSRSESCAGRIERAGRNLRRVTYADRKFVQGALGAAMTLAVGEMPIARIAARRRGRTNPGSRTATSRREAPER